MIIKENLKILPLACILCVVFSAKAQQHCISSAYLHWGKDSIARAVFFGKKIERPLVFPLTIPAAAIRTGLPPDYYLRGLGVFCKGEWIVEKKTGMPFRFRLGSLEYVNRLEGN